MTTDRFDTAQNIVNEAGIELGLWSDDALDVYASTDAKVIRMRTLLNSCGQELVSMPGREWPSLDKTHSFAATAAVAQLAYGINALPTDLERYIPGTAWNQTDDEAVIDATRQTWERVLVSVVSSLKTYALIDADRLLLYPPAAGDTITIRYSSRYWVKSDGQTTLTAAKCTANGDTPYFTPLLLKRLLKLRYALATGLDSSALLADFETTLAVEVSRHAPAPTLNMQGRGSGFRFIDGSNVPDTGYGE